MNKELLQKYLNNSFTDKEFEKLVTWVMKNAQNEEGKSWSFEHWKMVEPELKDENKEKYSTLLDKKENKQQGLEFSRELLMTEKVFNNLSIVIIVLFSAIYIVFW